MNALTGLAAIAKNAPDKDKAVAALDDLEGQAERIVATLNRLSDVIGGETAESDTGSTPPDLTGKTILVVDDVDINRTVLTGIVEMTGASVVEAGDGTEAVSLFESSAEGHFSMIFMDIMMPKMDGNEAAKRIRAMSRGDATNVPIIAISGNALPEDAKLSLESGMNRHLAKPVDFDIIMRTLREFAK